MKNQIIFFLEKFITPNWTIEWFIWFESKLCIEAKTQNDTTIFHSFILLKRGTDQLTCLILLYFQPRKQFFVFFRCFHFFFHFLHFRIPCFDFLFMQHSAPSNCANWLCDMLFWYNCYGFHVHTNISTNTTDDVLCTMYIRLCTFAWKI